MLEKLGALLAQHPAVEATADLVPGTTLRAAINTANPVLAEWDGEQLSGLSVELARMFANWIGRPLSLSRYASARSVVAAKDAAEWDIAFLAIDPQRATEIHFSPPYLAIEATYLLRPGSRFERLAEVDQPGVTVASTRGAAYNLYLERMLKHATQRTWLTVQDAVCAFLGGQCDVLAGIRPALATIAANNSGYHVLNDNFSVVPQAICCPSGRRLGGELVDRFALAIIETKWVAMKAKL